MSLQTQSKLKIDIRQFTSKDQNGVEQLVLPIQQIEFRVPITREEQPDLLDIPGTFQIKSGNFWIAIDNETVVGCVGLVDIGNGESALKKMFVAKEYRGHHVGVAASLLATVKHWCHHHGINTIFLGTVEQLKAAHRFYEKNGFTELSVNQLPPTFPLVHVDTKFYRCDLAGFESDAAQRLASTRACGPN